MNNTNVEEVQEKKGGCIQRLEDLQLCQIYMILQVMKIVAGLGNANQEAGEVDGGVDENAQEGCEPGFEYFYSNNCHKKWAINPNRDGGLSRVYVILPAGWTNAEALNDYLVGNGNKAGNPQE